MKSISPGKIIVAGEYVGIFGEPIVITGVNLKTTTTIEESTDAKYWIMSDRFPDVQLVMSRDELKQLWQRALTDLHEFELTGKVEVLKKYRRFPLDPLSLAVAAGMNTADYTKGLLIRVNTELPVGAGLGSSASMASSVIGAVWSVLGKNVKINKLNEKTYLVEKILNGNPSGGDNSGVVCGGWINFRRIGKKLMAKNLHGPRLDRGWWMVDGGIPEENTLELIALVIRQKKKHENKFMQLIEQERKIIDLTTNQVKRHQIDPFLLNESQLVLEEMGVIGERGKRLIRAIWKIGAAAKVSGAGGIKGGVGTILVYCEQENKLKNLAKKENFGYKPIILGEPGWFIEE